ncbi:MAG: hypothetical protein BGO44_15425 [Legionella sp. 39-23]|nr:MAG: hypothetical protein BGO44_15425 [Legionella sp. 39-23]
MGRELALQTVISRWFVHLIKMANVKKIVMGKLFVVLDSVYEIVTAQWFAPPIQKVAVLKINTVKWSVAQENVLKTEMAWLFVGAKVRVAN